MKVKVSIQGLTEYNPKSREYLIKIGSLLFPFKSMNEVFSYFLGRFTLTRKLRQSREEAKTKHYFFFLSLSYVTNYLTTYLTKLTKQNTKTHQNSVHTLSFRSGFF